MMLSARAQLVHNGATRHSVQAPCVPFARGVHTTGPVRSSQKARSALEEELARAQQDQKLAYDGPGKEYGPVGPKGAKVEKVRLLTPGCPLVHNAVRID